MDGSILTGVMAGLMAAFLVLMISLGISVAIYIIGALGVQTLAKRRGMDKTWLAWLPVGQEYLLGKMADDINLEEPPFKRHNWMIWYPVVAGAYLLFQFIDLGVQLSSLPGALEYAILTNRPEAVLELMNAGSVLSGITTGLASLVSLALTVVGALLMYRIYKRYNPAAAIAFTICGALFGLHWLFIFLICKKAPLFAHYPQNAYGAPTYSNVPPQEPPAGMQ